MSAATATRRRRVLVTGVGGAPGLDLARALARRGLDVIAVDADPMAPGLHLDGATARIVPPAHDHGFTAALLEVCAQERPDLLVSTVEAELGPLLDTDLDAVGVRTWLPSRATVHACGDKAVFHRVLTGAGVATPRTYTPDEIDQVPDGVPLVVKPRHGQGAKDVVYCHTRRQARVVCEIVPAPIVQERLTGREFTADCLVDRDGTASVILRYRLRVRNGLAMVAETFHDPAVEHAVRATLTAVGAQGLGCVQGFVTGHGGVMITEMNARIAGAFPLSEQAGADLVGQYLAGLTGAPIDHARLTYRDGVRLTKHVETLAVTESPAVPARHGAPA